MKLFVRILMLVALALFIAGCDSTLAQTTPDFTPVREAYGVDGAKVDAAFRSDVYNITFGSTLNADTGTNPVQNQLMVTFNGNDTVDRDALKETTLAGLEAKLKEFLHFYTVKKETDTDNRADGYANKNLRTEITDWKVVRRSGASVYLEFPSLANAYSNILEAKIDSTKYTYRNGQKVDLDDNGVAGEAFYDDYYTTVSVTTNVSASTSTMVTGVGDPEYVPIAPINLATTSVGVSISVEAIGTSWDGTTNLGFSTATATSGRFELRVTIPDRKSNYADKLKGWLSIEELGETGWAKSSVTPTFTRRSGSFVDYYATITLNHRTVYRLVLDGIKDAALENEVNGGKKRILFTLPGGSATLRDNKLYSNAFPVANWLSTTAREVNTNGWFGSATIGKDSEDRNVTVTIPLASTGQYAVTTYPQTAGDAPLGLADPAAAVKSGAIKLGLVKSSSSVSSPSLGTTPETPSPGGLYSQGQSFNVADPSTWSDNITFVNIVSAELRYNSGYKPSTTPAPAPDRLILYLDPEFRLTNQNTAYLFISGAYSYGGGDYVFGNWANLYGALKGFRAYGPVGSSQW